jgi:hypothetical protein
MFRVRIRVQHLPLLMDPTENEEVQFLWKRFSSYDREEAAHTQASLNATWSFLLHIVSIPFLTLAISLTGLLGVSRLLHGCIGRAETAQASKPECIRHLVPERQDESVLLVNHTRFTCMSRQHFFSFTIHKMQVHVSLAYA